MIIGIATLELQIEGSNSLKEKRRVIKSIIDKVKNRFNVSIAEVDNHELWQRTTIGIAVVSTEAKFSAEVLNKVVNFIEDNSEAILLDYHTELL